jgi:hypothetical protein
MDQANSSAQERTKEVAAFVLADLTANLMRISRGHGDPLRLPRQLAEAMDALAQYQSANGTGLSSTEVHQMLRFLRAPDAGPPGAPTTTREHLLEEMISASVQVAASRLSGSKRVEGKASIEMLSVLRAYCATPTGGV